LVSRSVSAPLAGGGNGGHGSRCVAGGSSFGAGIGTGPEAQAVSIEAASVSHRMGLRIKNRSLGDAVEKDVGGAGALDGRTFGELAGGGLLVVLVDGGDQGGFLACLLVLSFIGPAEKVAADGQDETDQQLEKDALGGHGDFSGVF